VIATATGSQAQILKSLGQLPPFSPVLNKLLASLAKEDVSFTALASLIEKDTVMSGNVLKLVNSAAYARRGQINSIPHAISVLGLTKLRNVVLGLSISRMWASVKMPKGWSSSRFNLHAVSTAVLADHLAQSVGVNYPEGAFISGLLHDFGVMLIAIAMPNEYQEVQDLHALGGRPVVECEMEILGTDHTRVTGLALAEWNLPDPIQRAARYHHEPASNPNREAEKEGEAYHLSEIVASADDTVNRLGHSIEALKPLPVERPEELLFPLLKPEQATKVYEQFAAEFETIRAFF
jgi:HD-like signal output (HDOD) protein